MFPSLGLLLKQDPEPRNEGMSADVFLIRMGERDMVEKVSVHIRKQLILRGHLRIQILPLRGERLKSEVLLSGRMQQNLREGVTKTQM